MATGWPTKVTYANGDVFNASDINDTNGTLNYISPVSATNNQVLTRDSASPGQVKWANSPANTLTTTGDLYYASAANTPARLGIGTTAQVLQVSGGVPVWGAAGGSFTSLATGTLSSTSVVLSSISGAYQHLYLIVTSPQVNTTTGNPNLSLRINGDSGSNYKYYNANTSSATATVSAAETSLRANVSQIMSTTANSQTYVFYILNYANAKAKNIQSFSNNLTVSEQNIGFYSSATAITSLTITTTTGATLSVGAYTLYGVA